MKEGVGKGKARRRPFRSSIPIIFSLSQSLEIKELESIIGEESLTSLDKKILNFGKSFEQFFMNQRFDEESDILITLNWRGDWYLEFLNGTFYVLVLKYWINIILMIPD